MYVNDYSIDYNHNPNTITDDNDLDERNLLDRKAKIVLKTVHNYRYEPEVLLEQNLEAFEISPKQSLEILNLYFEHFRSENLINFLKSEQKNRNEKEEDQQEEVKPTELKNLNFKLIQNDSNEIVANRFESIVRENQQENLSPKISLNLFMKRFICCRKSIFPDHQPSTSIGFDQNNNNNNNLLIKKCSNSKKITKSDIEHCYQRQRSQRDQQSLSSLLLDRIPRVANEEIFTSNIDSFTINSSPLNRSLDCSIQENSFVSIEIDPQQSNNFQNELENFSDQSQINLIDFLLSNRLDHKMIVNRSSQQQNDPTNQPSYVNISRVNHGYVPYNRYTSEYRRDDSLLRGPAHDEIDRFTSLPTSKGFLRQKIESLYGETFAEDWNKKKGEKVKKNHQFERPLSPADQIQSTLSGSKLFQKIKSLDNSDIESKPTSNLDKDWWLREHQALDLNDGSGESFLIKLNESRNQIQNRVLMAEKWLEHSDQIPDECVGKIRAAIGKANLLLEKKFQQFQKICEDSMNQSNKDDQFKIENDDLQGFWDTMMIQVNDVNQMFDQLIKLKQHRWQCFEDQNDSFGKTKIQTIRSRSKSRERSSPMRKFDNHLNNGINNSFDFKTIDHNHNNSTINNNLNSPKDRERQRRLMEIKRRGKMLISNDEEIQIFAPEEHQ
ncbi:Neuropathy target esterase [Sarcoptes scabiei]|nr:Neuropathy target esterase [Sarcoptes scabiei]